MRKISKRTFFVRALPVLMVGAAIGGACYLNATKVVTAVSTSTPFTFAVANDFDLESHQSASLATMSAMGQSDAAFTFLNGDLAQGNPPGAATFCSNIQSNVNKPTFILSGNHDTEDGGPGYSIGDYTTSGCAMPTTTGAISAFQGGSYLQDYYVDYPATNPKLRIIAVSPELLYGGSYYDYSSGSARYNWVSSSIDAAKTSGEWVVLAFHKPYLNAGSRHGSGGIGPDVAPAQEQAVYNLALSKKVDLIIDGHEHNYMRGKQLALGSSCSGVTRGSYNAACVVDDGSDASYIKGAGSVQVINLGAGSINDGNGFNAGSGDAGFFAAHVNGTVNGYMKYSVSDSSLTGTLLSNTGATLDSFTITQPDTALPTAAWVSPSADSTVSGHSITLKATATDNIGIATTAFYGSTSSNFTGATALTGTINYDAATSSYSLTIDTTALANGPYYVQFQAADAAHPSTPATTSIIKLNVNNVSAFSAPNSDDATSSVSLSGTCNTISSSSTPSLHASLSAAQLLTSFAFTTGCSANGGSATVTTDLGAQYNASQLKVYKDQSNGSLKDVTAEVTIKNQNVGGVSHTFVIYTVADGSTGDVDGKVDGKIVDPVYILDSSLGATSTTSTSQGALASTGTNIAIFILVATSVIALSGVVFTKLYKSN